MTITDEIQLLPTKLWFPDPKNKEHLMSIDPQVNAFLSQYDEQVHDNAFETS